MLTRNLKKRQVVQARSVVMFLQLPYQFPYKFYSARLSAYSMVSDLWIHKCNGSAAFSQFWQKFFSNSKRFYPMVHDDQRSRKQVNGMHFRVSLHLLRAMTSFMMVSYSKTWNLRSLDSSRSDGDLVAWDQIQRQSATCD